MVDVTVIEATCIGCGCTDSRACPDGRKPDAPDTLQTEPCTWVWVNRAEGRGLCTSCDDGTWETDPEALTLK